MAFAGLPTNYVTLLPGVGYDIGTLSTNGTWFKVSAGANQGLKINFTNVSSGVGFYYELYKDSDLLDGNENELYSEYASSNEEKIYKVKDAGNYYIKVYNYGTGWTGNPFKINYSLVNPDSNEYNDTWETATILTTFKDLTLNGYNDIDWFKVTAGTNQAINISFSNVPTGIGFYYELYKESDLIDGNKSELYSEYASSNELKIHKVKESGNYYIKVSTYKVTGSLAGTSFKINYSLVNPDSNEYNDTWENATALSTYKDLTLNGNNDVDWFKVTSGANQAINVGFTNVPTGIGFYYKLYKETDLLDGNENGYDLYSEYASSNEQKIYKVKEAGNYYIKVIAYSVPGSLAGSSFKINYSVVNPDINEYNDTFQAATNLASYKDLTLSGDNDVDWFKITAEANQAVKIGFSNVPTGMGFYYELYKGSDLIDGNENGYELYSQYASSNSQKIYTTSTSGNYYIKVFTYKTISGSLANAPFKITYGDQLPSQQIQFSSPTYSVTEGTATVPVTVSRINGSSSSATVNYMTSNGTATAGSDYTATFGTLTFAVGETTKTFSIPIINDTTTESNETVILTLNSPSNGVTLGIPSTATLTIVDNDSTLATPILVSPSNNQVLYNYPRTTNLSWKPVTGATYYKVERQYYDSTWKSYPVVTVSGVNNTSYKFDFIGDNIGRWRVTAYNSSTSSSPAAWSTFAYSTRQKLLTPVIVSPVNNSYLFGYPRKTTLTWKPVPGSTGYRIERQYYSGGIWVSYPNITVNGPLNASYTFDFVGDQPGRWRVTAIGSPLFSDSSPSTWCNFTHSTTIQLVTPILVSPVNNVNLYNYPRTTTLTWKPVPGSTGYLLEAQYYSGGIWKSYPNVTVSGALNTSYTFNFAGKQPGRWRVTALGASPYRSSLPSVWWNFIYNI